jgi:hypothetical protein
MNGTDGLDALRRANPRHKPGFPGTATELTRAAGTLADAPAPARLDAPRGRARRSPSAWRRPVIGIPAAAAAIAVVVVAALAVGSPGGSPAVSPAAAIEQAVIVSAQAAEDSGTVAIEMTQDGGLWASRTVRWNGSDIVVTRADPGLVGRRDLLVVGGILYGPDPENEDGWIELGDPASIDPDSGTTPDEYLATVRADVGGHTFRRITEAMADLTTSPGGDGSTVYQGTVPAGVLAPETGTKEGQSIRVLPYGYVAHDDAEDPAAPLAVRLTVRADGTIAEIHATWGGASSWSYRLSFSDLGSTPAPTAPDNPRRLCVERGIPCPPPVATRPGG